jgi:hypothetical protein
MKLSEPGFVALQPHKIHRATVHVCGITVGVDFEVDREGDYSQFDIWHQGEEITELVNMQFMKACEYSVWQEFLAEIAYSKGEPA